MISAWADCLTHHDLTITDERPWVPELPKGPDAAEEKIRVAVQDIECKHDVGMVQTLADLEASYQATLIRENETQLVALRQEIEEQLKNANDTIAAFSN